MTTTILLSIALLVVCWGIPTPDDVTNFLRGQVLCSAMNFSQKNYIFLFQGLASHIDRFVEEEVEVRHIPHLAVMATSEVFALSPSDLASAYAQQPLPGSHRLPIQTPQRGMMLNKLQM